MLHPLLLQRLHLLLPPLLNLLLLVVVGVLGAIFLFAVTTELQVCWRELCCYHIVQVEEFGFCEQKGTKRERKVFGKMSFGDELMMPPISP